MTISQMRAQGRLLVLLLLVSAAMSLQTKGVFQFSRDLLVNYKTLQSKLATETKTFQTRPGCPDPPSIQHWWDKYFASSFTALQPHYTLLQQDEPFKNPRDGLDRKRTILYRRDTLFSKDKFVVMQDWWTEPQNYLGFGTTNEEFQGQGYGTWLVNFVVDQIRANNPRPIHAQFGTLQAPERKLHKNLGFTGTFDNAGWERYFVLEGNPKPVDFSSKFF